MNQRHRYFPGVPVADICFRPQIAHPGFGKPGKGVALFALKQLVLQIMGNARRNRLGLGFIRAQEGLVNGTVPGAEYRIG